MFTLRRAQRFKQATATDEVMELIIQNNDCDRNENYPSFDPIVRKMTELADNSVQNGHVSETPITSPTPSMKRTVAKVKNVARAMTYMRNKSIRTRLKTQMKKMADERLTIRQIFSRYVDQSTLHGFRYTCSGTHYLRRFVWACLMVLGAIYFTVKLKEGIIQYYSHPFSTLSTLEYEDEKLFFPAITFCTVNQFKLSRLKQSPLYKLYLQNRLPLSRNWSEPSFDIPGDELYEELKKVSLNINDVFKECDWIRRDTAHPLVSRRNCSAANYTTHFSESGQICFTLNSHKEGHTKLEVEHFGLKYGYEAIFDFNNNDVVPYESYTGFHVIVHDHKYLSTGKTGFVVAPGFKVFVNMQLTETINLKPPYSTKCGEKDLKYFHEYSQKSCLMERLTDYVGKKCGCREIFMPDESQLPYCSLNQTISCAFPAKESFDEFKERLECPIECEVVEYATKVTEARFIHDPPIGVEPEVIKGYLKKHKLNYSHVLNLSERMNGAELDNYVENNVLEIIFFFGDMSKIVHTQEATFDFFQFLGDMGGEIGLMLGASLLTFVEFMDLIIFLIYHQLLRLNTAKHREDEEDCEINSERETRL